MTDKPRGLIANVPHVDEATFLVTPGRQAVYEELMKNGNSDTIKEKVAEFQNSETKDAFADFDFFEHPPIVNQKDESVFDSNEKTNDYIEDLVATKGKETMQQQDHDIVITTEQVESLKESIESPVEVLEGNQTVEQLDQTFTQAAGRGHTPHITRVDESPFVPEEQLKGDESYALKCDAPIEDNLVFGNSMKLMAADTGATQPTQIVDPVFTAGQVIARVGTPEQDADMALELNRLQGPDKLFVTTDTLGDMSEADLSAYLFENPMKVSNTWEGLVAELPNGEIVRVSRDLEFGFKGTETVHELDSVKILSYKLRQPTEVEEAAKDESFALPGDDEVIDENHPKWPVGQECYPKEVQLLPRSMGKTVTFDQDKQALLDQIDDIQAKHDADVEKAKEKRAVILGAGPGRHGAQAMAAALEKRNPTPETPVASTPLTSESKSQRKKRLAAEHNAKINPNKLTVVKFRPRGLSMTLELLQVSPREIEVSKDRGDFAFYTTKSAHSAPAMRQIGSYIRMNRSTLNALSLDWLLDQIGENAAFEVRNGRLRPSTPLSYTFEKTEAEWLAKGFTVRDGNVKLFNN